MSSKVTVTAKVGPGISAAATSIKNVISYNVDLVSKVMAVRTADQPNRTIDYDVSNVGTFTTTIAANGDYTITLS